QTVMLQQFPPVQNLIGKTLLRLLTSSALPLLQDSDMRFLFGRYSVFLLCVLLTLVTLVLAFQHHGALWIFFPALALSALGVYDLLQTRHAVRRNYPVTGNLRYLFDSYTPELR